jgi:hypothetical protein
MVDTKAIFNLLAADRRYVKIRWNFTGDEEIRYLRVVNPGVFDLFDKHENAFYRSRLYPEDIGNKVTLLEVMQPA